MPDPLLELVCHVGAPLIPEQPWVGWMLVALCRQRDRQRWLLSVHDEHLRDVDELQGPVPTLPGWAYEFHGSGLCLQGPGGDLVDMDFHEGPPGATIDPMFFAGRVRTLTSGHPEARLRALLPSSEWIAQGLRSLRRHGALHHPSSTHVFRLAARLEHHHQAIANVDFGSRRVRRRWGQAFGDDPDGLRRTRAWAVEQLRAHRSNASLLGKSPLTPTEVEAVAGELVEGPVDSAFGRAVDALRAQGVPPTAGLVASLGRLDPAVHHPYPAHALTAYLLDHDVERSRCLSLLEAFAAVDVVKGYRGNPYRDHLALLMARHAPDRAWPLFRRAAEDPTPAVHEPVGALLALHPDPRAPRLLLEAALGAEPGQRRFLLACLAQREDDVTQILAETHMPSPPESSEAFGFSFEEVRYASLRANVERRIAGARQTLASLSSGGGSTRP